MIVGTEDNTRGLCCSNTAKQLVATGVVPGIISVCACTLLHGGGRSPQSCQIGTSAHAHQQVSMVDLLGGHCVSAGHTVAPATNPSPGVSMQVQALTDVNQRLQSSLADTTKAHQAERLKRDNLHKQVVHHCRHRIQLEACVQMHLL